MDHCIDQMVAAVERTGQRENTLIIFTSDNGGSGPWKPKGRYPGSYDACPDRELGLATRFVARRRRGCGILPQRGGWNPPPLWLRLHRLRSG